LKKVLFRILTVLSLVLLVACGGNNVGEDSEELPMLEVEFIFPNIDEVDENGEIDVTEPVEVDVGETVEFNATVTYGDEMEPDAVVEFEVWETGDQENSEKFDAENHGDGTYTAEYTFEQDGIFEMYAHTDAHDLHTMPKRKIIVGEGGEYEESEDDLGFHTDGFDMHFVEPKEVKVDEETELSVYITLHESELENANVRYEIWQNGDEDNTAWVDAEEIIPGEYVANHIFEMTGTYNIQIHVQDDEDLHEHAQYEVEVE